VDKIAKEVAVEPRDATVKFSDTALTGTESRQGLALNADRLKRRIKRAIATQGASRTFTPSTSAVKPKVSTADLAEQYPAVLTVDRKNFKLRLFKGLKLVKTYDVRVGQQGLETPAGLYHIQNKAIDPAWNVPYSDWTGDLAGTVVPGGTPENPLKARWLGIYDGAGIHGIDPSAYGTIGSAASHGCVGMRIEDVKDLYDQVPVGAPIYID
jgi:lipoprotein-anchoring transpeptidase ErfK/SrfK